MVFPKSYISKFTFLSPSVEHDIPTYCASHVLYKHSNGNGKQANQQLQISSTMRSC